MVAELQAGPGGLSAADAHARLERVGPNRLPEAPARPPLELLLDQLRTPLIWALLAAGGIALALGEIEDGLVVLAVVVLNALIGFAQEYRAGRAIAALAELVAEPARVRRDGAWVEIPAEDVVPGDLLEVAQGDRVAADVRLLDAAALRAEEAALTGESEPVDKGVRAGRPRRPARGAPQRALCGHGRVRGKRARRHGRDRHATPSSGGSRPCSARSSRSRRR